MAKRIIYPNIDMQQTGRRLKNLIESAGYTPCMIQDYLHLSCVQPIYRWYKGLILPSVDHLFMLSELLNVHMQDFLVKKNVMLLERKMPILIYFMKETDIVLDVAGICQIINYTFLLT